MLDELLWIPFHFNVVFNYLQGQEKELLFLQVFKGNVEPDSLKCVN